MVEPSVSVVVPCYNYARFLGECIDSVLAQRVRTEILIINDASSDDSRVVADRLAAEHSNVTVRHHETNAGHIATYNEGLLGWAAAPYSLLLSADDRLVPGALDRAVGVMERFPDVGMVYGHPVEFTDGERVDPAKFVTSRRKPKVWDRRRWLRRRFHQGTNVVATPTAVVRTSIQHQVGGYNPDLPHAADFELWLRIALVADVAYVRSAPQALYRVHQASMSQGVYVDPLADVAERKRVFDSIVACHADEVRAAGVDLERTYRAVASTPLWAASRLLEKGHRSDAEIERILSFAIEAYPHLHGVRAYRALNRRLRLGEKFCHRTQVFVGTALVRRLINRWWWFRWERNGG